MGYRSKVIIGVEKKHDKDLEKLLKKHDLISDMGFKKVKKEDEEFSYYEGEYLKWYNEFDEVREVNEFIEEKYDPDYNDGAFLICLGEDGQLHTEIGDYWDHVDYYSDIQIM